MRSWLFLAFGTMRRTMMAFSIKILVEPEIE
jgi:hypothetical protein